MKKLLLGALYLSLAASIWGGMFVVVKVVIAVIPPVQLVWLRYVTALVVLYFLGRSMKISWKIRRKDWKKLFLIGFVGNTISIVTQETGTMLSSAQMGSIITAATPAFMVFFARILLREFFTWQKILSVVLATSGVVIIVIDPDNLQIVSIWGGVSLIAAAVTWAIMSVLLKKLPSDYSSVAITFYAVCVPVILLAPYSLWWLTETADWGMLLTWNVWGSVLYLGIVSTAGGFILWNKGLLLMDASVGGLFFFFQPIVGTGLGWLFLGETITELFWLGSLLIVFGVVLAMRGGGQTEDQEAEAHLVK